MSGLGRSLSALLGESIKESKTTHRDLAIESLVPGKYQPRSKIDDVSLLTSSIKQHGVLQPIVVRKLANQKYEIIAGERRWRASKIAKLAVIPAIIHKVDDKNALAIAIIENIQRQNLNPLEQINALSRLKDEFNLTHQEIADILGKSRTYVSNYLRLDAISLPLKKLLESGALDMGHARAILSLNPLTQQKIAKKIIADNLSVRQVEQLVDKLKHPPIKKTSSWKALFNNELQALSDNLKTSVKINSSNLDKGSLVIKFNSQQELKKIFSSIID